MSKRRRIGQAEAQRVEAAFEIRPAAGSGMDRDPCRLVDYQDQPIAIEDAIDHGVCGKTWLRHSLRLYSHHAYSAALRTGSRKRSRSASHSSAPKRRNISGTVISLIGGG